MSSVTVSKDKSTFCRDKEPFFYLADTIWSAFTNITEDEWIYYLKRRKEQGLTFSRLIQCRSGIAVFRISDYIHLRQRMDIGLILQS